jgi:uncharacterized protein (DUF1330 family)
MSVYVVAQLKFTDIARYRRYQSRFAEVFAGSGGRLLVADEAPRPLEGVWPFDKIVIMAFDDDAAALAFLESPAYRAIAEDRLAGGDTTALLAKGFHPAGGA